MKIVLSGEHAGNDVPRAYRHLFAGQSALLTSHRGHDPGTLELGQALAAALNAPFLYTTVTRLLVDCNRSPWHRHVFSELSRGLDRAEREAVLERYHTPHRARVTEHVARALESGERVLHLGIHSFTPVLSGTRRDFDIGWLYDSKLQPERHLADRLITELARVRPDLRQRRNAPYLGSADGLTTTLRRHFGEGYLGLELEVNQAHPLGEREAWRRLVGNLCRAISTA